MNLDSPVVITACELSGKLGVSSTADNDVVSFWARSIKKIKPVSLKD